MKFADGERIGPYEIQGELGNGGMGVVYRAMHVHLRRPAAIKVLRPEYGGHSLALDRFLNEARATTAIRHPGIVEIYDYGHTDSGAAYIAMELLEGVTLGARLAKRSHLPLSEVVAIARGIAAPLAAAHEAGIVHRDLKPENVFLVGERVDRIKLLDFGIAKLESSASRTTAGLILGTPTYMSPEQCRGITDCDHRADLYALGCVLYELLVGVPPFGRDGSMSDLMAAHLEAAVPELSHARVPLELRRLVARLLAKSPADRPANAGEVLFELDRYIASTSWGTTMVASPVRPSLRAAITAAAGLALSLAAIGAWYRSRRTPIARAQGSVIVPAATPSVPGTLGPPSRIDAGFDDAAPTVAMPSTIPLVLTDAPTTRILKPRIPPPDAETDVLGALGSARAIDVNTTVPP